MAHQGGIMESWYSESSFKPTYEMKWGPTVLGCPVCWPVMASLLWLIGSFNKHPVTIICELQGERCRMLGWVPQWGAASLDSHPWKRPLRALRLPLTEEGQAVWGEITTKRWLELSREGSALLLLIQMINCASGYYWTRSMSPWSSTSSISLISTMLCIYLVDNY